MTLAVLNLAFHRAEMVEHLRKQLVPIGNQVRRDVGEGPSDVGRNQVHDLFSHGRETPDSQVAVQNGDGNIDFHQQVTYIVCQLT